MCGLQRSESRRAPVRPIGAGARFFYEGSRGTNYVAFQGRLSRKIRFNPGDYTVVIHATNAAGSTVSQPLDFTIYN